MEDAADIPPENKKQKREKPNKKWTECDVDKILDYLQKSHESETPTAQFFYNKLIEKTGIVASWSMIRWKVRNLRSSFNKANEWRRSTGARLLESDEGVNYSVQKKIIRMCPYYDQLKEIFGEKPGVEGVSTVLDTEVMFDFEKDELTSSFCINEKNDNSQLSDACSPLITVETQRVKPASSSAIPNDACSPLITVETQRVKPVSSSAIPKKAQEFAIKMKSNAPKSAIAQLSELQKGRSEMLKIKHEFEKQKFEKDQELQERRQKLEEDKFKAQQEWQAKEFELKKTRNRKK